MPPCHGTARGTRAARDASTWLCVAEGQAGDAGLGTARVTGDKSGDVQVLVSRMCSSLPPHRGWKGSHVTSYSQGSCLVPEPNLLCPPHFPVDQLSRNSFCLESSQVFFLFQSCSNCPKAPGSWIAKNTKGSTWSTTGKPSSTITPFLLLTSGPCHGLQRPETKPVRGSYGRAVPNPCFLHRGQPTSPLGRPQWHLAQPRCLPYRFSQGQSCLWEGAVTLQSTWAGKALLHSAFLLGSVAGEEG